MNLFVAGLPYDLDDAELEEIFEKFGKVLSAKVSMDRETGKSRGFGFVQMEKEADARDAIEHLNDISLGKKPLVVKIAEDKPGGGGGGERGRGDLSGWRDRHGAAVLAAAAGADDPPGRAPDSVAGAAARPRRPRHGNPQP